MKRLVLNMVCRKKYNSSDSGGALVYPARREGLRALSPSGGVAGPSIPNFQLGSRAESSPIPDRREGLRAYGPSIPLFLRDVGRYYWHRKSLETEYALSIEECVKNELWRTFDFLYLPFLLFESVKQGKIKIIKYYSEKGILEGFPMYKKNALFQTASDRGDVQIAKCLLENGTNIHYWENRALRYACGFFKNLEMVKWLVYHGSNIQTEKDHVLRILACYGYLDLVKYMIENGADMHSNNDQALCEACKNGHFEVVKFLVANGADVHAENEYAVRLASENGHLEVTEFLIQHGAVLPPE